MKILVITIPFLLLLTLTASGQVKPPVNPMQSPIENDVYNSVVKIARISIDRNVVKKKKLDTNQHIGTGFIVNKQLSNGLFKFFLVTNKHVVGDWSLTDSLLMADSIMVSFYTNDNRFNNIYIRLRDKNGIKLNYVHEHPTQTVDIVVLEITQFVMPLLQRFNTRLSYIDYNTLASLRYLEPFNIFMGSQVYAIGYPSGITSVSHNKPIIKAAFIASETSGNLDLQINMPNRAKKLNVGKLLNGKFLLLDGLIVGGNSGGPIITPRRINMSDTSNRFNEVNRVIGIVSSSMNDAGITIVYSTDYIKDLINSYSM